MWIPLLFACHWSAWGLVHASSNGGQSSSRGNSSTKRMLTVLMQRPVLYNALVIAASREPMIKMTSVMS